MAIRTFGRLPPPRLMTTSSGTDIPVAVFRCNSTIPRNFIPLPPQRQLHPDRKVLAVCISCPACNNSCFDNGRLGGISGRTGQVCPTRRGNPGQHARLGLFEPPALKLFDPMMMPAERREIAFAGPAALFERKGMVVVAFGGGHPAPGMGASLIADLYQMPQRWRRPVIGASRSWPHSAAASARSLTLNAQFPDSVTLTPVRRLRRTGRAQP